MNAAIMSQEFYSRLSSRYDVVRQTLGTLLKYPRAKDALSLIIILGFVTGMPL